MSNSQKARDLRQLRKQKAKQRAGGDDLEKLKKEIERVMQNASIEERN